MKDLEHLEAMARHNEQRAVAMLATFTGLPVTVSREDRLEGAIIEAMNYLQLNAPEQAYDVLHRAYNFRR